MIKNSYDKKHLTLIARKTIQDMLNDNKKLVEIAKAINKDPGQFIEGYNIAELKWKASQNTQSQEQ